MVIPTIQHLLILLLLYQIFNNMQLAQVSLFTWNFLQITRKNSWTRNLYLFAAKFEGKSAIPWQLNIQQFSKDNLISFYYYIASENKVKWKIRFMHCLSTELEGWEFRDKWQIYYHNLFRVEMISFRFLLSF